MMGANRCVSNVILVSMLVSLLAGACKKKELEPPLKYKNVSYRFLEKISDMRLHYISGHPLTIDVVVSDRATKRKIIDLGNYFLTTRYKNRYNFVLWIYRKSHSVFEIRNGKIYRKWTVDKKVLNSSRIALVSRYKKGEHGNVVWLPDLEAREKKKTR